MGLFFFFNLSKCNLSNYTTGRKFWTITSYSDALDILFRLIGKYEAIINVPQSQDFYHGFTSIWKLLASSQTHMFESWFLFCLTVFCFYNTGCPEQIALHWSFSRMLFSFFHWWMIWWKNLIEGKLHQNIDFNRSLRSSLCFYN